MTDQEALERLLAQRDAVPPIDDTPSSTALGEEPADPEDEEEAPVP